MKMRRKKLLIISRKFVDNFIYLIIIKCRELYLTKGEAFPHTRRQIF